MLLKILNLANTQESFLYAQNFTCFSQHFQTLASCPLWRISGVLQASIPQYCACEALKLRRITGLSRARRANT